MRQQLTNTCNGIECISNHTNVYGMPCDRALRKWFDSKRIHARRKRHAMRFWTQNYRLLRVSVQLHIQRVSDFECPYQLYAWTFQMRAHTDRESERKRKERRSNSIVATFILLCLRPTTYDLRILLVNERSHGN